jgi:heme exporter protein B
MKSGLAHEIIQLIKREVVLELKQRHALNGILLYVISTTFVCYLSFKTLVEVPVWNALFWIIMLFASVNAVSKGFASESRGRSLYYYSLSSAEAIILARILYNALLMVFIAAAGFLVYAVLIGNLVQDMPFFLLALVLGSTGFSSIFTLVSAIASRSRQSGTLMAILGFPVVIPMLLVLIRFSKNAVDGLDHSIQQPYIIALVAIQAIVIALAWVLFPYLWKE